MSAYLIFRIIKFAALLLFAGGVVTDVLSHSRAVRMKALVASTIGIAGTWGAGWAMMKLTERTIAEPWILVSLAASLITYHLVATRAHKAAPHPIGAVFALAGLLTAVGVMSTRTTEPLTIAILTAAALVLSAPLVFALAPERAKLEAADPDASWAWFRWLGRFEGASLLVLFVAMPLKHGAGISLDGGTGLLGWMHGVLFIFYLQALVSTGGALGWGWGKRAVGALLALLPGGTFLFEYKVKPKAPKEPKEPKEAPDAT